MNIEQFINIIKQFVKDSKLPNEFFILKNENMVKFSDVNEISPNCYIIANKIFWTNVCEGSKTLKEPFLNKIFNLFDISFSDHKVLSYFLNAKDKYFHKHNFDISTNEHIHSYFFKIEDIFKFLQNEISI